MPLVQCLRHLQRARRGKSEALVRVALQTGEIEQQRRELRGRLAFLRHDARLAEALRANRLGARLLPDAFRARRVIAVLRRRSLREFFIEPAAGIISRDTIERAVNFPIRARHEFPNLLLALDENRQRRRLHAADRGLVEPAALRVEGRHRARAIDPDEPVRLAAAHRRIRERAQIRVAAQMREAVANRRGRHRLQPEPLDRLLGAGVLNDVAEDQFPLAPGVTRVDELIDILALEELLQRLELVHALLARIQIEVRRNDGKIGQTPLALLGLEGLRARDFEQVPDRRRDDVLVALVVVVLPFQPAQRLRDVRRDRGFLCDNKRFAHDDNSSCDRPNP